MSDPRLAAAARGAQSRRDEMKSPMELATEDHARARRRHDELLWHLALDRHHGVEASTVHGNQIVRVDLL